MNVLHVHYVDQATGGLGGGAAVAMLRVHRNLRKAGVGSRILCREKLLAGDESLTIPRVRFVEGALRRITARLGLNNVHALSTFRIPQLQAYRDADVLNLHCIHGGYFNYLALPALTRNKPAVLTLHDMWSFTGHCANSFDCERWKSGCGQCPYPRTYPPIRRDATRLEWRLKDRVYGRSNLAVLAVSRMIADKAEQSMLRRFPIHCIPNGVDTAIYEPLDADHCRAVLGVPPGKRVLMAASMKLDSRDKGGDLLVEALKGLPAALARQVVLVLLGTGGEAIAQIVNVETLPLGYVSQARLKALAYSAADVFIHPTRAETLGLVLLESLACGTPAVSFAVGGVPELVRHGRTGYLARAEDARDLTAGIVQLLEDEDLRQQMGRAGRRLVTEEYSAEHETERHLELYHRLVHEQGTAPIPEVAGAARGVSS